MSPVGLGPPPAAVPPRAPLGPPYSPSAIINLNPNSNSTNMSGNSLTDALFLLTTAYLSVVQPAQTRTNVGLYTLVPNTLFSFSKSIVDPLKGFSKSRTLRPYRNIQSTLNVTSALSKTNYTPRKLLQILCDDVFPQNTITAFYVNSPGVLNTLSADTVVYVPQILSSLGLPIISYDTQFSFSRRPPLSLQLAPTMGQMMDVFFAFLKRYNWTDFSFLCTVSIGCQDEMATIRLKVAESQRRPVSTKYGMEMFPFKLLSAIKIKSGHDKEDVKEQLFYEMDRDTRIVLVHGEAREVMSIMGVATELGLTGRDYVWLFTKDSIKISTYGFSTKYPIGSFVIGFDSNEVVMKKDLMTDGLHLWLQALNSLAGSEDMEEVDFETGFSCQEHSRTSGTIGGGGGGGDGGSGVDANRSNATRHRNSPDSMRWKYGEILYKHLLKTKYKGEFEFDEYGILKANKFWIMNVQPNDNPPAASAARGSGFSIKNRLKKPSSFGNRFSGASRSSGSSTSSRDGSSSPFSNRDRSPQLSRDKSRFSGSSRDGDNTGPSSGNPYSRNRNSRPGLTLESRSLRTSAAKSFLRRPDRKTMTRPYRSDEERLEMQQSQTTVEPPAGEDRFVVGESNPLKSRYRITSSTDDTLVGYYDDVRRGGGRSRDRFKRDGPAKRRRRLGVSPSRGSGSPGGSPQGSGTGTAVATVGRRRKLSKLNTAKKIATWDGKKLKLTEIMWPGGAVKPPTGKPDKYVLRVATWKEEPHVMYVSPDNTTGECDSHSLRCWVYVRDPATHLPKNETVEVCCSGLAMDLLKRLSEELDIDVDLHEAKLGAYGSAQDANRTRWDGLIGMVTRNEADLAMAAMSITPERSAVVEFSTPFLQTGITIIVAIRPGVISPTAFLEPYDYLSWTLILVFSVHATGTSIFIFEWLSPYGLDHGKTPLSVHKFSLFRSFWLIWAMLFGASVSTDMPRGCASRFLANIWALFAVVFCASYTANLAAFMITKDDFYDLSGIQDWRLQHPHHRQPPFKFATVTNSSTERNIEKNYPQIHRFMSAYGQYDVKEAIESLKKQEIQAFIYDSTTLEYEVGKDVGCKLKTVGKRIAETGYGVAFPKKSQWTKKFNAALLRLQEDGEIERIQKFWLAGACHKKKEGVGVSSHTLGILNFTSAFILLGGGIIIGALLLTLEHMYFRFGRKQLKKWDKYGCCSLVSLSMGQSLTFERSVMEAIDFHKHHKCKDPICETQLWKVKHELDLALLKISQLRKQIAHTNSDQPREDEDGEDIPPAQPVGGEDDSPVVEQYHNGATAPRRRRQTKADEERKGGGEPDTATKSLLQGDSDDEDTHYKQQYDPKQTFSGLDPRQAPRGHDPNDYSLLQEPHGQRGNNVHHPRHHNNKPKPKPPPRNSSYSEPEPKPAVKPRPPAKRPHERSSQSHAHANTAPSSRDNGVSSRDRDEWPSQHQAARPPQPQPQNQHPPHGNKVHPKRDDPAYNNIPDRRSNNPASPSQPPDPILCVPPPPPPPSQTDNPLKLHSPTADGTAPPSRPSAPSPPLPPPPSPPPIIDNIQDPCSNDSPISSPSSSRPTSWTNPNLYDRAGAMTPAPLSDPTMYEPLPLDPMAGYPHPSPSPSSPTSSSSQTSHNPPLSPGGVSQLSNEGMSLPSSPDRLSYSSDTLPNPNPNLNTRHLQDPPHHAPSDGSRTAPFSTPAPLVHGSTNTTNPFLQQSPDYSNSSPSSLDNQNSNSSSEPNSVVENKDSRGRLGRNGDVTSMASLKEADNDVDSRRGRSDDGNVYVNVDDVGGKETTF